MDPLSIVTSLAPTVLGFFAGDRQAKRERKQALADDASRFVRLREAAQKGGFNPLTALELGGTSGVMPSGMVSSFDVSNFVHGATSDLLKEVTGMAAQERAHDRLSYDLDKLRLEQVQGEIDALRAGAGVQMQHPAAGTVAAYAGGSARPSVMPFPASGSSDGIIDGPVHRRDAETAGFGTFLDNDRRAVDVAPHVNTSPVMTLQMGNFGLPIIGMEGEPLEADQALGFVIQSPVIAGMTMGRALGEHHAEAAHSQAFSNAVNRQEFEEGRLTGQTLGSTAWKQGQPAWAWLPPSY